MPRVSHWLTAFALALSAASLWAAYPEKPVRLVVPFPAGGSVDLVGRLIAQRLSTDLKQPFIVENRPGAGGGIGADVVAKAAGDGYTLLLAGVSTHAINPALYRSLPYDPVKDFAPISLVVTLPNLLVVNPALPVHSVEELTTYARANPRKLSFASSGNGTTPHLSAELFVRAAGIEMVHVPYKGSAPALADLVGGQVQLMFDNIPTSLQLVRAGKLRALAVTGARRSRAAPDVPTVAESGYPGYVVISWQGLFAPARTPTDVIDTLSRATRKVLSEKALQDQLARDGVETAGNAPAQFAAFLLAEMARWAKVVRESGARIE